VNELIFAIVMTFVAGFSVVFAVYAGDKLVKLLNDRDILLACIEQAKGSPTGNSKEEKAFADGWNAGLAVAQAVTEELAAAKETEIKTFLAIFDKSKQAEGVK